MVGTPMMQVILKWVLCGIVCVSSTQQPVNCQATKPSSGAPPHQATGNWYGKEGLWVQLWPGGVVQFKKGGPGLIGSDGSLSMKFPWYREIKGKLVVTGRRIDKQSPPLRAE